MSGPPFAERYAGYLYAYPHKTAYRPLDPPVSLAGVWAGEPAATFLYVHVPFCEMRCGYCNLFTLARPGDDVVGAWLGALGVQAGVVAAAVGAAGGGRTVARMAVGGGTPTFLAPARLDAVFDLLDRRFAARPAEVPCSVEVSPRTARPDRLAVLADRGVGRVSIGVESFEGSDLRALGRPQRDVVVHRALAAIRAAGFPVLNIDLIYGAAGQSVASWRRTLAAALAWAPEELYAYPLYRRPLTGLGGERPVRDLRAQLYEAAVEVLADAGYEQVSMRMFRRGGVAGLGATPDHDCQEDPMVGLGCGARSYTAGLHYADDYAVAQGPVASIVDGYVRRPAAGHGVAGHGVRLDPDDRRRRHVIKGVLRRPGLDLDGYRSRFGSEAAGDFPLLRRLEDEGMVAVEGRWLVPTGTGLAWSDAIGPALVSQRVRSLMAGSAPR